jgi:hypothetical protein
MKCRLASVVFSFRDEEEVLTEHVRRTTIVMRRQIEDHELVFVDDASEDRSFVVTRRRPDLPVRNPAIRLTLRFARRYPGSWWFRYPLSSPRRCAA